MTKRKTLAAYVTEFLTIGGSMKKVKIAIAAQAEEMHREKATSLDAKLSEVTSAGEAMPPLKRLKKTEDTKTSVSKGEENEKPKEKEKDEKKVNGCP
ncbi:hypothetical protein U1Q18_040012 [Sarracenia purpurea var. burkii]